MQYYTEEVFHTLIEETANMAVRDSGCTKTVCGREASFRFGDSKEIKVIKSVEIPARIVGHFTDIKAEVVGKDIPLLLSRKAVKDAKDAKVHIDVFNDKTYSCNT